MSWLSKATGIHLGNIGAPVGMALGSLVGMPTVGAALGGAVGGLGHGDGVGSSLLQGAMAGGGAAALGGLGSKIPGVSAIQSKLGGVPGLGAAKDFLTGNGGKNLLGLAQGINAATTQRKSNNLANDALATQQGIWDANAPLRDAGRSGMLNPGQGIAAKLAAVPRGPNPYAPATPQLAPVAAPPRRLV